MTHLNRVSSRPRQAQVTVALANKMARIAWALMMRKEVYRANGRAAAAAEVVA